MGKKKSKRENIAAAINPGKLKQQNGVRAVGARSSVKAECAAEKHPMKVLSFLCREGKDNG